MAVHTCSIRSRPSRTTTDYVDKKRRILCNRVLSVNWFLLGVLLWRCHCARKDARSRDQLPRPSSSWLLVICGDPRPKGQIRFSTGWWLEYIMILDRSSLYASKYLNNSLNTCNKLGREVCVMTVSFSSRQPLLAAENISSTKNIGKWRSPIFHFAGSKF